MGETGGGGGGHIKGGEKVVPSAITESLYWCFLAVANSATSGTKKPSLFSSGAMYLMQSVSQISTTGPAVLLLLCMEERQHHSS